MAQGKEMEKAMEEFKKMQNDLMQNMEARNGLTAQQQENLLVKEEFDKLEEDGVVYKLVGPILVKQNISDAKANVDKRLEYITGEMDRSNKNVEALEEKLEKEKQRIMKMQAEQQQQAAGASG